MRSGLPRATGLTATSTGSRRAKGGASSIGYAS